MLETVNPATGEVLATFPVNARRVLRPRRVRSGLAAINQASTVEYQPLGVVGVIGPWNYPVFTPIGSIAYALAAGNAVVFKPSELTPATGEWLVQAFNEALGIFGDVQPVLQLVTGPGSTGSTWPTGCTTRSSSGFLRRCPRCGPDSTARPRSGR